LVLLVVVVAVAVSPLAAIATGVLFATIQGWMWRLLVTAPAELANRSES
jgi:hypothetical protein